MRHIKYIALMILLSLANAAADNQVDYILQGEYKHDTLDYNDQEKTFYRGALRINLSEKSFFNTTHIYIATDRIHRYTYNLALLDISESFKAIVGNYNINYGAGLLMGRKQLLDPDIFAAKTITLKETSATVCANGNPIYCLHGAATTYYARFDQFLLSLNGFYSIRNRFLESQAYTIGKTSSSLSAIAARIESNHTYTEPGFIFDRGAMAQLAEKNFLVQLYYFNTELNDSAGKTIEWNYVATNHQATGNSHNHGIYAQYRDDYITAYIEYGMPGNKTATSVYQTYRTTYGLLWGIKYAHPSIGASLIYKDTDDDFYAPSATGSSSAEKSWTLNDYLNLGNHVTLGSELYSNKKKHIYAGDYLPDTKRESLSCLFRLNRYDRFTVQAAKALTNSGSEESTVYQYKANFKLSYFTTLHTNTGLLFQHQKEGKTSRAYSASVSDKFFRCVRIKMAFSQFYASKNNALYAASSPFYDSITTGFYIKESSQLISTQLSLKYWHNIFAVRYLRQFRSAKAIHKRLEFFGKMLF